MPLTAPPTRPGSDVDVLVHTLGLLSDSLLLSAGVRMGYVLWLVEGHLGESAQPLAGAGKALIKRPMAMPWGSVLAWADSGY